MKLNYKSAIVQIVSQDVPATFHLELKLLKTQNLKYTAIT